MFPKQKKIFFGYICPEKKSGFLFIKNWRKISRKNQYFFWNTFWIFLDWLISYYQANKTYGLNAYWVCCWVRNAWMNLEIYILFFLFTVLLVAMLLFIAFIYSRRKLEQEIEGSLWKIKPEKLQVQERFAWITLSCFINEQVNK